MTREKRFLSVDLCVTQVVGIGNKCISEKGMMKAVVSVLAWFQFV